MTEDLSGEVFSDWARAISTRSDSLFFFFECIAMACNPCPPKERTLASPSLLKGMVLLSEEGNNRSRWRQFATCAQLVLDLPAPLRLALPSWQKTVTKTERGATRVTLERRSCSRKSEHSSRRCCTINGNRSRRSRLSAVKLV